MQDQDQAPDIRQYLQVIYKRRYACALAAAAIMAVITGASYFLPKVYEASTTVSIERNYLDMLMRDVAGATPTDDRVQALSIVMTSRSMLMKVLTGLGVPVDPKTGAATEKLLRYFQKHTQVKFDAGRSNRRDADLFTVTYRDRDPQFARDYVNALVQQYVVENLLRKRNEAAGANRFVYEQMEQYKGKIDSVEAELKQRKGQRDVQAATRLAGLRKRYDDLLTQYTERHPEVQRVKAEIESAQEQVRRVQRDEAANAGQSAGTAGKRRSGVGEKSVADLERDRDAYKKIYEALVASVGRSEMSAQVEAQDNKESFNILEPAVLPIEPVGRPRWQIILLGIVAGLAGGIGTTIVLDMTDRTIKGVRTLKDLGVPVIGMIPRIENAEILAANRRKDLFLYGASGAYVAVIMALATVEYLK